MIQVTWDGTDVTNYVIRYKRNQQICTGIGRLNIQFSKNLPKSPDPWDVIVLYEQGDKKGTYYVETHTYVADEGFWDIEAIDGSKKLKDYFEFKTWSVDYMTYARYWIKKILSRAKIKYSFTTSDAGAPVGINTTIGMESAFNLIQTLLQSSGWYIYFNANGKAIIGDINRNIENYNHQIDDSDIIKIELNKDDRRLRNRAVVWGNADSLTGTQVFKDISVQTPWNYDSNDKRAVVLSNSMIRDNATATELARNLLNEFAHILYTKNIEIATENSIEMGDSVLVESKFFNGIGLVTTIGSDFTDNGGLVTTMILSEKCPRLFAYFNYWDYPGVPVWVYIGTTKDGVWRRLSDSTTWYDNSTGFVDDLHIKDLHIRNGVFAAVTKQGNLYTRTAASNFWNKYELPDLTDQNGTIYPATSISGVACSVNDLGYVVAGYNYVDKVSASGNRAWVLEMTPYHYLLKAEQVVVGSNMGQRIHDLEAQPEYNIVSTSGTIGSGMNELFWITFGGTDGENNGRDYSYMEDYNGPWQYAGDYTRCTNSSSGFRIDLGTPSSSHYFVGPADTGGNQVPAPLVGGVNYSYHYSPRLAGPIIDEDSKAWQVGAGPTGKNRLCWVSLTEPGDFGYYEFNDPLAGSSYWRPRWGHLLKSSDNLFEWILVRVDSWDYGSTNEIVFYHLSYVPGSDHANLVSTYTINATTTVNRIPYGMYGKGRYWVFAWEECASGTSPVLKYYTYNLDAQSGSVHTLATIDTDKTDLSVEEDLTPDIVAYDDGAYIIMYYNKTTEVSWTTGMIFFPPSTAYKTIRTELYAHAIQVTENGVTTHTNHKIGGSGTTIDTRGDPNPGNSNGGINVYSDALTSRSCSGGNVGYSSMLLRTYHWDVGHERYVYSIKWPPGYCGKTKYWSNDNPDINAGRGDYEYDPYHMWDAYTYAPGANSFNSKNSSPVFITVGNKIEGSNTEYVNHINAATLVPMGSWCIPDIVGTAYTAPIWTTHNMDDANNTMYFYSSGIQMFGIGPGGRLRNWVHTNKRASWGTWVATHNGFLNASDDGLYFRFAGDSWQWIYDGVPAEVLKHTSIEDSEVIPATDTAALQTRGEFEVLYSPGKPVKVENSKYSPTVVYSVASGEGYDQYSLIAASVLDTQGSFYLPSDERDMKIYDARVIDISNTGGYVIASGDIGDLDFERYIMAGSEGGIYLIPYLMQSNWSLLNTVPSGLPIASGVAQSGIFNAVEATNYTYPNPFIFYSISGAHCFYQRNPDSAYFVDYSAGLPDSEITIIRTDDEI